MEAVEEQIPTFSTSAPGNVGRSNAHPMEAVQLQMHSF